MRRVAAAQRSGFTLIEMIFAIALFAVIMVATYNVIAHAVRVRDSVDARGEILRAANSFFTRLEREITSAYVQGGGKGDGGGIRTVFRGLDLSDVVPRDGLVFTCNCGEVWSFGMEDSNRIPHTEIAYDFVYHDDPDMTLLTRRQDTTMDDDALTGGFTETMWPVLRGMNLRFMDPVDKTWKDEWDSAARTGAGTLPQAVEITLWLAAPESDGAEVKNPIILGKTIMIPTVAPIDR